MTEVRKLRICMVAIALLVIAVLLMAYKFIIAGSTLDAKDGRTVILLEPAERTFVLREMRGFLAGTQRLVELLANEDLAQAATLARSMGAEADSGESAALMGKLPLEFKTLGMSVHADFDRMAKSAESKTAPKDLLRQLGGTLQKCVACHDRYQFGAPGAGGVASRLSGERLAMHAISPFNADRLEH